MPFNVVFTELSLKEEYFVATSYVKSRLRNASYVDVGTKTIEIPQCIPVLKDDYYLGFTMDDVSISA